MGTDAAGEDSTILEVSTSSSTTTTTTTTSKESVCGSRRVARTGSPARDKRVLAGTSQSYTKQPAATRDIADGDVNDVSAKSGVGCEADLWSADVGEDVDQDEGEDGIGRGRAKMRRRMGENARGRTGRDEDEDGDGDEGRGRGFRQVRMGQARKDIGRLLWTGPWEVVARSVSRWLVRQALSLGSGPWGGGWKGARTFSW